MADSCTLMTEAVAALNCKCLCLVNGDYGVEASSDGNCVRTGGERRITRRFLNGETSGKPTRDGRRPWNHATSQDDSVLRRRMRNVAQTTSTPSTEMDSADDIAE